MVISKRKFTKAKGTYYTGDLKWPIAMLSSHLK